MRMILLFTVLLIATPILSEDIVDSVVQMDDVVVTGSRTPIVNSELARSVVVISRNEIANSPARSVEDIIAQAGGVDIRRRGAAGVQSDLSIRGTTFEQTLILIDGIKVNDPQTGHHNGDIPVSLDEIEKIEVLKGPASRLYGPNAMGGVVNIITADSSGRKITVESSAGDFGLFERRLSMMYPSGAVSHKLSVSKRNSTGHLNNTEFDILNVSYNSQLTIQPGKINLSARYSDKDFGAHSFYSDRFPDEYESTETMFFSGSADLLLGKIKINPRLFWKQHKDDFILDRNRPDWYRNKHTTDMYGGELQASIMMTKMVFSFGGELAAEEIESTNLKNHYRNRYGVFAEVSYLPTRRLSVVTGVSLFGYSTYPLKAWPGIDIGYQLSGSLRLYSSAGKSFRVPTFTDLYYSSPANNGNENLYPEQSWTYEFGAKYNRGALSLNPAVFHREGRNMIDYIWLEENSLWQAENISSSTTRGIELNARLKTELLFDSSPISYINFHYAFLETEWDAGGFDSKYLLEHLKHQIVFDAASVEVYSISNYWRLRYQDRFGGEKYLIADTRLNWMYGSLKLSLDVTNVFDKEYSEIGTIPMPGRWLRAGLKYSLSID
ncbi:MAG: TonB-dependent receptor [candidate division Zixibacteria bacterium]|nr:TonB-dependent receptor [candidate division Zixibacteria bacterium]